MKEKNIIKELNQYQVEPASREQIERCVSRLPDVKRRGGFGTILKLQMTYIPKWLYLLALLSFSIFAIWARNLNQHDMFYAAENFALGLSVVLTYIVILSDSVEMQEVENSCRFNYARILLARLMLVTVWMLALDVVTNLFVFGGDAESRLYLNMVYLLPIFMGLAATLMAIYVFQIRGSAPVIGTYMIVSMLADMACYRMYDFMAVHVVVPAVLTTGCVGTILVLGKRMMERKFINEAYNI